MRSRVAQEIYNDTPQYVKDKVREYANQLIKNSMKADIYSKLANSHPSLQRGMVWCRTCGRSQKFDAAEGFRSGWPKCCGYTMTIDSPSERALALDATKQK